MEIEDMSVESIERYLEQRLTNRFDSDNYEINVNRVNGAITIKRKHSDHEIYMSSQETLPMLDKALKRSKEVGQW